MKKTIDKMADLTPKCYQVQSITHETHDVFTLVLANQEEETRHVFLPGQFNMLYQFGYGEAAISISGNPSDNRVLVHTIRAIGSVTRSLQKLKPGDEIGVRGPFGTHWPITKKGCDVLLIAGGVGLAVLRSALFVLADRAQEYHKITLLFGAKTADDILCKNEMEEWRSKGVNIEITVDSADSNWQGHVGVVTSLIDKHLPNPNNTLVLICGPEVMIHASIHELMSARVNENDIHIALERNMQCAVGFCGHCQYGPYFLCTDGPIFSYAQIKNYLPIKEV